MNERRTDFDLLKSFTRLGDQESFAGVVRRHLDLVYATAFRKVEDPGAAQEIAQNVFTTLARKAWQFAPDDSLPAWLYRATLLEAKEWWRGEVRRRRREQTAAELGTTMKTTEESAAFRALVPLLDEALLSLREQDRAALLLRFYESQSLRDVGTSLGVGEDAAQKRVAGALEKLSRFFQRRGFKSATVAAAAAALQQTARSAPALVAGSVTKAALQMSPPALAGWVAWLAGLTKAQTVAVCLSVAAIPVAWQWQDYREAAATATRMRAQSAALQAQQAESHAELERLRVTLDRLQTSVATARDLAEQRADGVRKFEAWKQRIKGLLMADNYRWPQDSPFVRIPKSVLGRIRWNKLVEPSGVLTQRARELLGLSPQEREQVENALSHHVAAMNSLIDSNIRESDVPTLTNNSARFTFPTTVLASKAWLVPALGDEVKALGDELQSAWHATLGAERWPLLEKQLNAPDVDALRRILGLESGSQAQEVTVLISDQGGELSTHVNWTGGNTGLGMTRSGIGLASWDLDLPFALTHRVDDWLQQQAGARFGKEDTQ